MLSTKGTRETYHWRRIVLAPRPVLPPQLGPHERSESVARSSHPAAQHILWSVVVAWRLAELGTGSNVPGEAERKA